MENFISNLESFRHAIKYWWLGLIIGIAVFITGIVVFRYPGESYIAMTIFFGILIFLSGLAQIFIASASPRERGWGWWLASGIIEVILGIILMTNLGLSAAVLPFFLGFWLLFRGLSLIGIASDMSAMNIKGTGWTIFWAILLMLSAVMVLVYPAVGVGALVIWLGVSFMIAGISMIFLAIRLMSLNKELNKLRS